MHTSSLPSSSEDSSSSCFWKILKKINCYEPVNSKFQHPLGHLLGIWILFKFLFKFSTTRAKTLFKCPRSPRKLLDYWHFNFSEASIMLLKLFMWTWFFRQYLYLPQESGHISYKHTKSNTIEELTITSRVAAKMDMHRRKMYHKYTGSVKAIDFYKSHYATSMLYWIIIVYYCNVDFWFSTNLPWIRNIFISIHQLKVWFHRLHRHDLSTNMESAWNQHVHFKSFCR